MNTLKKGKPKEEVDSEEEKLPKKEDRLDLKLPFDMKAFWKNLNENFFRKIDEYDLNEANHLVHSYSKHGIINYLIKIYKTTKFTPKSASLGP